jgi:hypothetical protein
MHEFDHKGNKGWQKARRAQDRQSREVLSITCLLSYLLKKEEIIKKKNVSWARSGLSVGIIKATLDYYSIIMFVATWYYMIGWL